MPKVRLLVEAGGESAGGRALGPAASGPFNMGVDEALFATAQASGRPTLRFYTWDGPWLSLGYAQPFDDAGRQSLERAGVGLVRRATGGRAVLHGADLTYAIAAPEGLLPGGVRESYAAVADVLLGALGALGIPVTRSAAGSRAPGSEVFDCFAEPAADEICLAGGKLSGSAQRRVGGALLQHGSIRLAPDPQSALAAVARTSPGAVGAGATSLQESGHGRAPDELVEACIRAFTDALGPLEEAPLTPAERSAAAARGAEPVSPSHLWDATPGRIPANS